MIPERLRRDVLYESRWVGLWRDRVRTASGKVLEEMHVVHVEEHGVAAVVEDAAGRIVMVRVPRYATGTADWEVPQGRAAVGEAPEDAAARETREEAGWTSSGPERLHTFHPLPGLSDHVMHVVRLRAGEPAGDFDRDEVEEVRWFTRDEIRALVARRGLADGFTLLALFLHLQDR
jgi:8-oxo-dGTP pyrophosphatase MutT (NUDIX family)